MTAINQLIDLHEKQIEILKNLRQFTDQVCRDQLIEMYADTSKQVIELIEPYDAEDATLQAVFGRKELPCG
jgi:hypothetical protein